MDRCTSHIAMLSQIILLVVLLLFSFRVNAQSVSSDYALTPPLISESAKPLVMLVMSVDHELFKKAYSDYSDLDADGRLDTSYVDSFDYLGYFDSRWCYKYASDHYSPVTEATGDYQHHCTSAQAPWSGNFLNWATMTRMDIIRTVLFGGKRSIDSSSQTILERAYIPRDIHAFVKVYRSSVSGIPTENYTPYTLSEISLCSVSDSENGVPVVRMASGAWPRWASTEVRQCQFDASDSNNPSSGHILSENSVYVESCVNGKDDNDEDRCKQYPSGTSKPIGLLQKYGETGGIHFGLISGSYDNNISGGVLRKNITMIAGNDDPIDDEVNLISGQFNDSINGIIGHINRFRIATYSFNDNKYLDCSSYGIGISEFKGSLARSLTSNRHCSNWGNPIAEMYLEALRYFSGEVVPSNQYHTDDDDYFVPGITTAEWISPQTSANPCANCSIILLSTGLNSFDSDQFGSANDVPGINGAADVNKLTDQVGIIETATNSSISFPGTYLVDKQGGDRQCEEAEISSLSDISGICPELPQLEGGYQVAGLSWLGRTTDLRNDLDGVQSVKSYVIQVGENIPSFSLDVGGKSVTFQPVCQAHNERSECSLTDVVIDSLSADSKSGRFIFFWEDSLWGNDYDYDASSSIEYCIGDACYPTIGESQVQITVRQEAKNAGAETWYSYTVTGTSQDGIQMPFAEDAGAAATQGQGLAVTRIFDAVVGSSAIILPRPIWFAAKYGGFLDLDGDETPGFDFDGDGIADVNDNREWDTRNNVTGSVGSDGLPDNFFYSHNPTRLAVQFEQVLSDISTRVASANNAALFASSSTGTGAIYQALFQPRSEVNGKVVTWGGLLHSLFIDSKGHIREDGNGNDRLDDYGTDKIVELIYDPNAAQTMIQRYTSSDLGVTRQVDGSLTSLSSLEPIWDAREQLALLNNLTNQRTYSAIASSGRHILTWLDFNNNHSVDAGEQLPFIPSTFVGYEGYLGSGASDVATIVNYVRGEEFSDTRSRTIDFNEDGIDEVWRLGDIVHSTPRLVAAPDSRYDSRYQDTSYRTFRNKYLNRRHVLYVGANDGLIHAFNGGFWDDSSYSYRRTTNNGEVQHPLGAELWSYAPMNLLPHLSWLTESDYPHVYYVDSEPMAFDVNIFPNDSVHPDGWGTILVVGMRLGGGDIDITVNGNERTMRSAWVVMDITDPEQEPKLLAEITHENMGFTTSRPALIKRREAGIDLNGDKDWSSPVQNEWYLVFGSGPAGSNSTALRSAMDQGTSDQNLQIFLYDLKNQDFVSGFDPLMTPYSEAYAGDMISEDWNKDYKNETVYFGTVNTSENELSGQLIRLRLTSPLLSSSLQVFVDAGQPIGAAPMTVRDENNRWIFFGTGRLLTHDDNRNNAANYFYGVKEPLNIDNALAYGSVSQQDLVDVGGVVVFTNGQVLQKAGSAFEPYTVDFNTIDNFIDLQAIVAERGGWKLPLAYDGLAPSGRYLNQASRLFSKILFTEYTPPADTCSIDGRSALYSIHYQTGTASPNVVLGSVSVPGIEVERSLENISLGIGYASSPVVFQGESGSFITLTQGTGGSIMATSVEYDFSSAGRQSWRQIFKIPWID